MEMYLITGFLGSGKTTFIKNIIKALSNKRIYLIINEFGKEGIDGSLLKELGSTIAEINNGSIFCVCRINQFEESLDAAVDDKPDIILAEASGLSDPTNIRKIMAQDKYASIDYRGAMCLVDAPRFAKVVDTALVVRKQLSISSLVLINKTDQASLEQIKSAEQTIAEINPQADIVLTSFAQISPEILLTMRQKEYDAEASTARDITLQKYLLTISETMKIKQLEGFLKMIADDSYRIKGFVHLEEQLLLVDCVGSFVDVYQYTGEVVGELNKVVVLAGKGMPTRKSIKNAMKWYDSCILKME